MTHSNGPEEADADPDVPAAFLFDDISLHPDKWALFLDIDGTLLDLADTPDSVTVPPGLPRQLHSVSLAFGGAVALVTGRALAFADRLFAPFRFPIAGLHGAEWRDPQGVVWHIPVPPLFEELRRAIAAEAGAWPGIVVEDKAAAVAVHYRLAPEKRALVEELMARCVKAAGPGWSLQRGKLVVEIRPSDASKGHAVRAFLEEEPFRGRRPVAIGDDVTDETMFDVVNRLNGRSLRIGAAGRETAAQASLPSPAHLREMIARLAAETSITDERKLP